jgi:hypothetical protein
LIASADLPHRARRQRHQAHPVDQAIRRTLEAEGVEFIGENGGAWPSSGGAGGTAGPIPFLSLFVFRAARKWLSCVNDLLKNRDSALKILQFFCVKQLRVR